MHLSSAFNKKSVVWVTEHQYMLRGIQWCCYYYMLTEFQSLGNEVTFSHTNSVLWQHYVSRDAVTKHHKLNGLNNRNVFSHSPGD